MFMEIEKGALIFRKIFQKHLLFIKTFNLTKRQFTSRSKKSNHTLLKKHFSYNSNAMCLIDLKQLQMKL